MQNEYEILGQKIVVANGKEAELASFAVQVVNEKVADILSKKPMLGPQKVAILALLEIAGEMIKDRKAMDEYRRELDERCSALMLEVSQAMGSQQKAV